MNLSKYKLCSFCVLLGIMVMHSYRTSAQSIVLSYPSSSATYINSLNISYSITEPLGTPDAINIYFNCTSGACLTGGNPSFVLTMKTNTPLSRLFSTTSNLAAAANPFTSSASVLIDGTYTVYADFVRPGTSTHVVSSSKTNVKFDATTLAPIINTPSSNGTFSSQIPVSLTLPEPYLAGSAKLIFTNTAGTYSNTLTLVNSAQSQTFTLTTSSLLNSNVTSATYSNLPDDTYNMVLSYQDSYAHTAATSNISNMLIQTATPAPTLLSPTTGSVLTSNNANAFTYNLPSAPLPGTAILTLSPGTYSYSLPNQAGIGTYTITTNIPPDGTYTATISYQDFLGNPAASVNVPNILFDRSTQAPTIIAPLANTILTGNTTFNYVTPETAYSGSKKLVISQNSTTITTLIISDVNTGTLGLNLKNLTTSASGISSIIGSNSLPDGNYQLTFSYQDQYANPTSSTSINVTIDSRTLTPSLSSPITGGTYSRQIPVSLTLGEPYLSGSAKMVFVNRANQSFNLTLVDNTLSQTFTLTTNNVIGSNVVASSQATIPDEVYNVSLQYQDFLGNPVSSVSVNNVVIQTATPVPTITSPSSGTVFSTSRVPVFSYTIPSAPLSGTAILTLSPGAYSYPLPNQSGSGTYTITTNIPPDGTYTATISYQDFLGNPAGTSQPVSVIFKRITPVPKIISPNNNGYFSSNFLFKDSIPVQNLPGTKVLTIFKNNTVVTRIILNNNLSDSINFNVKQLSQSISRVQSITGADTLANGVHVLLLSYQDIYGNPVATAIDTINIDTSPLIGVLSHQNNIVFGPFVETITFNKPVRSIISNPIIVNAINNTPAASLGLVTANNNNTIFTFQVTPLQQGIIKLQSASSGIATDIAGNASLIVGVDSIKYVDTTIILVPDISGTLSFCQGDSTTLTSSLANTYLWSTGATTKSIVIKQGGTYNVKTTYDNNVKGLSNNVIVKANPLPIAGIISGVTNQVHVDDKIYLNANPQNGTAPYNYTWSLSDASRGSITGQQNVIYTGLIKGATNLSYHVVDVNNCTSTESAFFPIQVLDTKLFFVPTAFSPNNDGLNDYLSIIYKPEVISLSYFKVFNRFGKLVYETSNLKAGWDGRINGEIQNPDAFYWIAEYTILGGETLKASGQTVLIK